MAGAGTVRQERYGRAVKDQGLRAKREDEGLAAEPLTVIVSASMRLPADLPILQAEGAPVVVATAPRAISRACSRTSPTCAPARTCP